MTKQYAYGEAQGHQANVRRMSTLRDSVPVYSAENVQKQMKGLHREAAP